MKVAFIQTSDFGMNGVTTYSHYLELGLKRLGHTVAKHIPYGKPLSGWIAGWPEPDQADIFYLMSARTFAKMKDRIGEIADQLRSYGTRLGFGVHSCLELKFPLFKAIYDEADPRTCPVILPNRDGNARKLVEAIANRKGLTINRKGGFLK